MTRLFSLSIATALLASALPAVPALAAADDTVRVAYGDLNLSSDAGQAALNDRVRRAADKLCLVGQVRAIDQTLGCRKDVMTTTAPQIAMAIQNATVRFADAGGTIVVALR